MPWMAVNGVRISWETREITSFLVCWSSYCRVTSESEATMPKTGPSPFSSAETAARRRVYCRVRKPRMAISRSTWPRSDTRQTMGQALPHQAARGYAKNGAGAAVGKGDQPLGIGDQQAVFHGAQRKVDELGAIQQAGFELAQNPRLPFQTLGKPATGKRYRTALRPMVGTGNAGTGRRQQVAGERQFRDVGVQPGGGHQGASREAQQSGAGESHETRHHRRIKQQLDRKSTRLNSSHL